MSVEPLNSFEQHSTHHRSVLVAHGYRNVAQSGLSGALVQNQRWKTYWKAKTGSSTRCFIKVNYGYENPAMNLTIGQKEARLPGWFAPYFEHDSMIAFPEVIDSWEQDGHSYVVFVDQDFEQQSLFSVATLPTLAARVRRFLAVWSQIPEPPWWHPAMEPHDFALQSAAHPSRHPSQPFGFDLDDNIGLDPQGRLFCFDFEFIQWGSPELQRAYWCCKLSTSRRQLVGMLTGRNFAASLLHGPEQSVRTLPYRQAGDAYLAAIRHKRPPTTAETMAVRFTQLMMRVRSG